MSPPHAHYTMHGMTGNKNDSMHPRLAMGRYLSADYGAQCASDKLTEWGITASNRKTTTNVHDRAQPFNLLGLYEGTVLVIKTKEQAEMTLHELTHDTDIDLKPSEPTLTEIEREELARNGNDLAGNGMFIIMEANPNTTAVKSLIKLFRAMGWEYTEPAKDASGEIARILTDSGLSPDMKQRLAEHVGEQYDILLPIVRSLRFMPKEEQRALTWEELWVHLNPDPGTVPPWGTGKNNGLFDYVIKGDTQHALGFYDRLVSSGTPVIQFAGWLATLIGQYALMKLLLDYHGYDIDTAAHCVGLPAPSSGNRPDPLTGKRTGWVTDRNYRHIKNRDIPERSLRHVIRRTADDLTMIRKRGRIPDRDMFGDTMHDDTGADIVTWVDKPQNEVLPDDITGFRMVLRASETFAGNL